MLIGFVIRNFRSIHGEQRFSYTTSSDRLLSATHCLRTGLKSVPLLSKSAVIFGPNGGGKSNFLSALSTMRDLVLHSAAFTPTEFGSRYSPFLLDRSQTLATEFEIDVLLERKRYRYAFAYDGQRICAERLLVQRDGKAQRWFDRSWDKQSGAEVWRPFSNSFSGPRAMWRAATRPQALYLTTAAQLNAAQLQPLFHWFDRGLALVFASETKNLTGLATWIQDDSQKQRLLNLLRATGSPVEDMRVADETARVSLTPAGSSASSANRFRGVDDATMTIEFSHRRDDGSMVWLQSSSESAGLRRLVCLLGPLLAAIHSGQMLLIDEFDLSLHPLVARYVIELINNPQVSRHGAQVLLTSHNTTLMDMGILRRDEIWLMELDEHQASCLIRLWQTPTPPRIGELIGKNYLYGRYGAVPNMTRP